MKKGKRPNLKKNSNRPDKNFSYILSIRTTEDILAVDLKTLTPRGHTPHQSLGTLPLLDTVKHSVDKLSS